MIDLPLSVTPLEMLSLAVVWRRDRDLALRMAEQSAVQSTRSAPSQPMARPELLHNEEMK